MASTSSGVSPPILPPSFPFQDPVLFLEAALSTSRLPVRANRTSITLSTCTEGRLTL